MSPISLWNWRNFKFSFFPLASVTHPMSRCLLMISNARNYWIISFSFILDDLVSSMSIQIEKYVDMLNFDENHHNLQIKTQNIVTCKHRLSFWSFYQRNFFKWTPKPSNTKNFTIEWILYYCISDESCKIFWRIL